MPVFIGALLFIALIVWLGLGGWILPSVGGGLACIVVLFVIRIVLPATSVSSELDALIRAKAEQTMVPMHTI